MTTVSRFQMDLTSAELGLDRAMDALRRFPNEEGVPAQCVHAVPVGCEAGLTRRIDPRRERIHRRNPSPGDARRWLRSGKAIHPAPS